MNAARVRARKIAALETKIAALKGELEMNQVKEEEVRGVLKFVDFFFLFIVEVRVSFQGGGGEGFAARTYFAALAHWEFFAFTIF